jgi:hypothetical protein
LRAKTAGTGTGWLRWSGLVGAVLLAVAGYPDGLGRLDVTGAGERALPVAEWLAGTVLLAGAWLLLGGRLWGRQHRWPGRPGGRWLAVTGVLWALPLTLSGPLASRDAYAYACQGSLVGHGLDPYRVGVSELPCPWLSAVPPLWWHTPTPYGPLWLAIAGIAASPGRLALALGVLRLVALAGVGLIAWAGTRLARALGVDPVPAGWLALASPLVLVHGVSGVHNDALLAGLVMAALAAGRAARHRAGETDRPAVRIGLALATGALLGLAVAVKATALVVLPFAALLVAGDRRWGPVLRAGGLVGLGTVAGYGTVWAATGEGLGWLPALSGTTRMVQWTSLSSGVGMAAGYLLRWLGHPGLAPVALAVARAVGLVILALLLVALWLWARGGRWLRTRVALWLPTRADDTRRVVLATGLALAAGTLLAPVSFPWYALTPLAVLSYSVSSERSRKWLALVAAGLALLVLPGGTGLASLAKPPGALLDLALATFLLVTAARWMVAGRRAGPAGPTPTASSAPARSRKPDPRPGRTRGASR